MVSHMFSMNSPPFFFVLSKLLGLGVEWYFQIFFGLCTIEKIIIKVINLDATTSGHAGGRYS